VRRRFQLTHDVNRSLAARVLVEDEHIGFSGHRTHPRFIRRSCRSVDRLPCEGIPSLKAFIGLVVHTLCGQPT
jgi:hypothetical protein